MDENSVLGDAISYVKYLQERVKTLEEQSSKRNVQSKEEDEVSSSNNGRSGMSMDPEIEARVSNGKIRLKIQCERRKGVLVKILGEMERLKLDVVNSSDVPFGDSALDITIVAQMEEEFSVTVDDVVTAIHSAIRFSM